MIVLISPEEDIVNELVILHQLFEEGVTHYHVRKPRKTREAYIAYLKAIDKKYHKRIVTHHFHELAAIFDLKGIHFQEKRRRELLKNEREYFKKISIGNKIMSSSFHELEALINCPIKFDYHLLSPVFSSISKVGYKGRNFDVSTIDKMIVGVGGIHKGTIKQAIRLGFKGIGILGGVWSESNPVASFKEMKAIYNSEKQ
ncbi:thiamine phosphate synthase [Tenacibaculum maritimum]|uniref:thiamine phosphate synthase n=1 Tax=Tenacibaculum maritimum TaxID=107401 RepID=UPI0004150897|nr:thiamine phosphate synthase [Tenacibaculum maritimum]